MADSIPSLRRKLDAVTVTCGVTKVIYAGPFISEFTITSVI